MDRPGFPLVLPRCEYPRATDIEAHGLYELPRSIMAVDFSSVTKYRSAKFKPVGIEKADKLRLLEIARMVAQSFAIHEPMNRHFHLPGKKPDILRGKHKDPFGKDSFGPWTRENVIYWFIRMMVLTNSTDPGSSVSLNVDTLRLSLMVIDADSNPIGGAFNVTLSPVEIDFQKTNAFLEAVLL